MINVASPAFVVEDEFLMELAKVKMEMGRTSKYSVVGEYFAGVVSTHAKTPKYLVRLGRTAFSNAENLHCDWQTNLIPGICFVADSKEEFANLEKNKSNLLQAEGEDLWNQLDAGWVVDSSRSLARLVFVCWADLKKHVFVFFGAVISPVPPQGMKLSLLSVLSDEEHRELNSSLQRYRQSVSIFSRSFFAVRDRVVLPLSQESIEEMKKGGDSRSVCCVFVDSTNSHDHISRLALCLALANAKTASLDSFDLICVREAQSIRIRVDSSFVRTGLSPLSQPAWSGWEKEIKKRDLSQLLDPKKTMESSVSLNLKLMKWRMFPELDFGKLSSTKCLLIGAGTLGCYVARALLGWGVFHLTFVDKGTVSYSNPTRQCLYDFEDASNNKPKAPAAASAIKKVFPLATVEGVSLDIPMPGHPISVSEIEQTKIKIATLDALIANHDVVFLLTDSRESRWLPAFLAGARKKIVINAAIGFDSFLVMRHGTHCSLGNPSVDELTHDEKMLGCYFCSEVEAPVNSMENRPLDQQCTVTRPGTAMVASSYAVELLVALLHHPQASLAPWEDRTVGEFGIVPHQIRGNLCNFSNFLLRGDSFKECTCCSRTVLREFRAQGVDFLIRVFSENGSRYLEEITGLAERNAQAQEKIRQLQDCSTDDEDSFVLID